MLGQEAVQAGDPDVVEAIHPIAHGFGAYGRFLRDREVGRAGGGDQNHAPAGPQVASGTADGPGGRAEHRVGNLCSDRSECLAVGPGDEECVAVLHDPGGDGGNLLRGLAGPEYHLWKALPCPPLMVDTGESEIFERGLAQKLKDAVLRRLRCSRTGVYLFEELSELVTSHAATCGAYGAK